ncbi:MAG: class I SAM-dependent methyltransferase [Candidatus Methylacidiphilales bacterium]
MSTSPQPDFSANMARFTGAPGTGGYAAGYDRFRPTAPDILGDFLCRMAGVIRPRLVVDLGSGTGLSSRYWAAYAEEVIGIEPTDAMRSRAEQSSTAFPHLSYRKAFSHDTGLPYQCAQIVNCGQSLHWMDPASTFREAARILQPRGVFAAYDYDWPPATGFWEVDAAYIRCTQRIESLEAEHGVAPVFQSDTSAPGTGQEVLRWVKEQHLQRMKQSGAFRHVQEVVMHQHDTGDADRLVGLMLSQGSVNTLLKLGFHEEDIGIAEIREVAQRSLGNTAHPWLWSCRVRIGIT